MISEKLKKRIDKLKSENEIRITKRYIDSKDTIFDVATYIYENVDSSFFSIECELKYISDISVNTYNYSFEVQSVNDNRITDFNINVELSKKLSNLMNDVGYTNNICVENRIVVITIEK